VGNPTQVGLQPADEVPRDDATTRRGILMDNETVAELFEMFHNGDISANDLMMDLDIGGFDGDIIDFL
jgi:hypothetical protein